VITLILPKGSRGGREITLRATSHMRLRACDHYTSSTLIGGKGGADPSLLQHFAWGTNGVCECKMDVKSTWIPTWHIRIMLHGTWNSFKNRLLKVGLTQNRKTMALRTLTTVDLGSPHTWAKSCDLVMVRILDSHPKAVPCVLGKPLYVVTGPQA
jgi:hypothetical protein